MSIVKAKIKKLSDNGQISDPHIKVDQSILCEMIITYPIEGQPVRALYKWPIGLYNSHVLVTSPVVSVDHEDERHIVFTTKNSTYALYFYDYT